jgi:LacI family transcriptional regulator
MEEIASFEFDACLALVRDPAMEQELRAHVRYPVNISNRRLDLGLPQVVSDDIAVGRMAADFFIERGYRKFCYVWSAGSMGFSRLRYRGFSERLREHGLAVDERFSVRKVRHHLKKIPPESAVFVSDDQTAVPFCQLCDRTGLRLPEDVSVLSVDNDELFCHAHASNLSSIELDGERIGWEACGMIDRWRKGGRPPDQPILIPPVEVVERRSTDRYAVENKRLRTALGIINRQAHRGIRPEAVAEQVGVNRRTLENEFAETFGHSIHDHIRKVQVNTARKLLRSRDASLEEVASACGFASLQTFRRNFKERVGMGALEFREKHELRIRP